MTLIASGLSEGYLKMESLIPADEDATVTETTIVAVQNEPKSLQRTESPTPADEDATVTETTIVAVQNEPKSLTPADEEEEVEVTSGNKADCTYAKIVCINAIKLI